MKKIYQQKEAAIMVQRKISQDFGLRADAAAYFGLSRSHLDKILRGDAPITPELQDYCGLVKISGYSRK